jgi:hypothetical protein
MENVAVQKQAGETASAFKAMWDPLWFMREVFGWGRSSHAPSFDVRETNVPSFDVKEADDTYVCKVKVKLTLPEHADVAHAKAELDNGELTLVVPKAAAAKPELVAPKAAAAKPELVVPKAAAAKPEPVSPPRRTRRATGNRSGSAGRKPRRGRRTPARRG